MTPAWIQPDPSGASLWFNSTDVSRDGGIRSASTFKFDTTGDFGLYVFDRDQNLLLEDVWAGADMGVFWTALSRDGHYAAGGGWLRSGAKQGYCGQMKLWDLQTRTLVLLQATGSRVNHISMTPDGGVVAAACGQAPAVDGRQIYLWARDAQGAFQMLEGFQEDGLSALWASFSEDGQWLVAAFYGPTHLILFQVLPAGLKPVQRWSLPPELARDSAPGVDSAHVKLEHERPVAQDAPSYSGPYVKCVSMTPDGQRFAAAVSGKSGVFLFERDAFLQTGTFLWQKGPALLGTTSAVMIAPDGRFVVAAGNAPGAMAGLAYRVDEQDGEPVLTWSRNVAQYGANPNNRLMDDACAYVSFGTGQPLNGQLTPGQFFVLDALTGEALGELSTACMNWPFQLSGDGSCAFGGSDTGVAFSLEALGNWA